MNFPEVGSGLVFEAGRILLSSIGFWLIYSITRYYHFLHGFTISLAAYAAYFVVRGLGLSISCAGVFGIVMAGLLGLIYYYVLFWPLKNRSASNLVLLLVAIAVDIAGRNLISLIFGDSRRSFRGQAPERVLSFGGADLSLAQVLLIAAAIISATVLGLILSKTSIGLWVRAVADNPELAKAQGINVKGITAASFFFGSALAGLAGVLNGFDVDITPGLGQEPLIIAAAAVVLAGRESVGRLVVSCALLAMAQVSVVWWIGAAWREAIALLLLLVVLVVRPGHALESFLNRRRLREALSG